MTQEAIDAKNAYKREWYKRNRDKVRAAQERYWQRKAQKQEEEKAKEE